MAFILGGEGQLLGPLYTQSVNAKQLRGTHTVAQEDEPPTRSRHTPVAAREGGAHPSTRSKGCKRGRAGVALLHWNLFTQS